MGRRAPSVLRTRYALSGTDIGHRCTDAFYAHSEVGRHVSEPAFDLYMKGFERAVEARVVEEVRPEIKGFRPPFPYKLYQGCGVRI
eukprot:201869-Rhodomonas_salina.1